MNHEPMSCGGNISAEALKLKGFNAYEVMNSVSVGVAPQYDRRDFYKVCLSNGESLIHYADRGIHVKGSILFFGTPHIPYAWEPLVNTNTGFACVFTEPFLKVNERSSSLHQSQLFRVGGTPIFHLDEQQREFISMLFRKMIADQEADYVFKDEALRTYINMMIHEALKMEPSDKFFKPRNAAVRITDLFMELLERQFPVDDPSRPLSLRTAQDFADRLSVHVNHLNRSVKEVTGKSTTAHITERVISEAKALLHHTNWSVADIAYGLGFEYPTYFNNYFKRATGMVPSAVRISAVQR
jgi:AraC family transcriptional regulator, transcriptional activator of pobA